MSLARASRSAPCGGLGQADLHHLAGVVPFVDGGGDVEAFVALQANQLSPEGLAQHLGDLGLADAGLALQEQRPAQAQRQVQSRGERPVGDISAGAQKLEGGINGFRLL